MPSAHALFEIAFSTLIASQFGLTGEAARASISLKYALRYCLKPRFNRHASRYMPETPHE
jgi:hypothetical protein